MYGQPGFLKQWACKQIHWAIEAHGRTARAHKIILEIVQDFARTASVPEFEEMADFADSVFFA